MTNVLSHPIHLWPGAKINPRRINAKATVTRFQQRQTFYGVGDRKVIIDDIPIGAIVILHAGPTTRIKLLVK